MQIFNNWNVIAKGWYLACPSHALRPGQVKSLTLCGQRIVLFRGEDQAVRALHAYCPHLGTDLGLGRVEGNWIRCKFHQWAFDGTGQCQHIPCQAHIPSLAQLPAYATEEKYGLVWIYPDAVAPAGVAEFDELKGKELITQVDMAFERACHHHICMMNGIDAQHLKTIHQLDIKMELSLQENSAGTQIDFTMRGKMPNTTWRERLAQRCLGPTYEYSMRYADGCMGLLTIMKNVRLFPRLHMIYAFSPVPYMTPSGIDVCRSKTRIQPIYITEKRKGLWGWCISQFLLICTRLAYYMLRDEDGEVYDNIQFHPNILLSIDAPLARYMQYVEQLSASRWSQATQVAVPTLPQEDVSRC